MTASNKETQRPLRRLGDADARRYAHIVVRHARTARDTYRTALQRRPIVRIRDGVRGAQLAGTVRQIPIAVRGGTTTLQ